ncbi:hypothetical protein WJX72_002259 [[Myrmecia] bisecta]|uniref:Anamorsin homolog n=1 Tax=[Myrmecia] bisecta TaxID=41462 RepID=A0AAW1P720_9CHLO
MAQSAQSRRALVVTSGIVLPGELLSAFFQRAGLDLAQVAAVTNSTALDKDSLPKAAYDIVLSLGDARHLHSPALIAVLAGALRAGGSLIAQQALPAEGDAGLQKQLLLGGLVDFASAEPFAASGPVVAVTAKKPQWETGAKAAITLKSRIKPQVVGVQPPAGNVWKMALEDDNDELLDDEELLTEEDKQRPAVPAADDCEVGATGRKACKNCSCGRADMEAVVEAKVKPVMTTDMLDNPTSSCGSCALGDAFRCASCPYRGLPAFEMGKKIELPSDFLTADA